MSTLAFTKGVHDLGGNTYAYIQPDGSWGFSNAGLVVDGGQGLLVDTLFDLKLTREMLDAYEKTVGPGVNYSYLVCTHGNGDHTFGNALVPGAEIVASKQCGEEMAASPPQRMADLLAAAPQLGDLGKYFAHCFGAFDFSGIDLVFPTTFVEGEMELAVGGRTVRILEVGPAHTGSDVMVHVPDAGVLYTGDILFMGGMPIMWAGPLQNWLDALELIMRLDAKTIVPGHGPVTDKAGVAQCRDILLQIREVADKRCKSGKSVMETSRELAHEIFPNLIDSERVVIIVHALYREFGIEENPPEVADLFAEMAVIAKEKGII